MRTGKYQGPIFNAHAHLYPAVDTLPDAVSWLKSIGVERFLMCNGTPLVVFHDLASYTRDIKQLYAAALYPGFFRHMTRPYLRCCYKNPNLKLTDKEAVDETINHIVRMHKTGISGLKTYWGKPSFKLSGGCHMDTPAFDPIYAKLVELDLPILLHISDPKDRFAQGGHYDDPDVFSPREADFAALRNVSLRHPKLVVVGAHFLGMPDDLEAVDSYLELCPNLYLDDSCSIWIHYGCLQKLPPDTVREFYRKWQDRIMFGTDYDGVGGRDATGIIYRLHREIYDRSGTRSFEPAIDDRFREIYDNPTGEITGLDLPHEVLEKLYWHNAQRIYGSVPDIDPRVNLDMIGTLIEELPTEEDVERFLSEHVTFSKYYEHGRNIFMNRDDPKWNGRVRNTLGEYREAVERKDVNQEQHQLREMHRDLRRRLEEAP